MIPLGRLAAFAIVTLVVLAATGLSIALLVTGLRGRRMGNLTFCRTCDYDLRGSAGAERCPECGADFKQPNAIAIGQRQRRTLSIILGALGSLVAGATLAMMIHGWWIVVERLMM